MQQLKVTAPARLLEYLRDHLPLTRTKIGQLLRYGSVRVNGRITTAHDHPLRTGDTIDLLPKKAAATVRARTHLPFRIVHEDDQLIVIDKPSGLLTMGTDSEKERTAYYQLTEYLRSQSRDGHGRAFIVHRLDRETSGLVVFAKTVSVKERLQKNWGDTVKKYYAVVSGTPSPRRGRIESYLIEDDFKRVYSTDARHRGAQQAITDYEVLESKGGFALLKVTLLTGRKHQIRVHLADQGHPVVGDERYGDGSGPLGRLGLHAYLLSFVHPVTGKTMRFETDLPDDF